MCVRVRMWEDMIAPTLSSPLQPHSPSWASPHTLKSHFTIEQQPSLTAGFHDTPRYHSHVRPQPQWPPRCFADKRHGQAAAACPAAMLGAHRHPAKICQDLPRSAKICQDVIKSEWYKISDSYDSSDEKPQICRAFPLLRLKDAKKSWKLVFNVWIPFPLHTGTPSMLLKASRQCLVQPMEVCQHPFLGAPRRFWDNAE